MINSVQANTDKLFSLYSSISQTKTAVWNTVSTPLSAQNIANTSTGTGHMPEWLMVSIHPLLYFIIATIIIVFMVLLLSYLERRIISMFAPCYTLCNPGSGGFLQPVADTIKLLTKEDLPPKQRRKILFFVSPFLVLCPAIIAFYIIPFNNIAANFSANISAALFLALILTYFAGIFLTEFSNTKACPTGLIRIATRFLSSAMPLFMCVLAVAFMAGSLNINEIILAQSSSAGLFGWYFLPLFLGAAVFFASILIILNKTPFNLQNTENTGLLGYYTEHSGAKLALLFMAQYVLLFILSAIFASFFFGGYLSPLGAYILPEKFVPLEQTFWLLLKTFIAVFFIILTKAMLIKPDSKRVLEFSYKILLPISLINLNVAILALYLTFSR